MGETMKIHCDGSCGCKGEIVELSYKEMTASTKLDEYLDRGWSLETAVSYMRNNYPFKRISRKFWEWKLGTRAKELV